MVDSALLRIEKVRLVVSLRGGRGIVAFQERTISCPDTQAGGFGAVRNFRQDSIDELPIGGFISLVLLGEVEEGHLVLGHRIGSAGDRDTRRNLHLLPLSGRGKQSSQKP
jgi:hypothetical protein